MMRRFCLWTGLCFSAWAQPLWAQTAEPAASDVWSVLSTPSALRLSPARASRDTTQSIARRQPPALPEQAVEAGWNLSSDAASASLIYATPGKAAPVGFICRKGDGYVTFRSPPVQQAPGKRVLVLLKSPNGAIRIETKVRDDHTIFGESPVRTSSLVFVLTPKKGDARLTVGSWSTEIGEGASDVKLLRFQSLCDQPTVSADAE